jgi:hypothetical protein
MSDNPYTLRFEIWREVNSRLVDKYYQDHQLWQEWNTKDAPYVGNCPINERPQFPTDDDVITEATKVYNFVQKRN